jgi:hypothetical protein
MRMDCSPPGGTHSAIPATHQCCPEGTGYATRGARRVTPRMAACVAAVIALVAGAIPAVAANFGGKPTTYYACVTTRTGAIRIVSAAVRCRAGQHKISWNSQGPARTGRSASPRDRLRKHA